jgi:iron complex outermembrane receptor protein
VIRFPFVPFALGALVFLSLSFLSSAARAQVVAAEPEAPVDVAYPVGAGVPAVEAQVTLQLVVDATGHVESAVVVSRVPVDAPAALDQAAVDAVKKAPFRPSTRDGRALRSRVEYVVVFHAPATGSGTDAAATVGANAVVLDAGAPDAGGADASPSEGADAGAPDAAGGSPTPGSAGASPAVPATANGPRAPVTLNEQDEDYAQVVEVRGLGWSSPRGIGDIRIKRELLEASPRQQTSEMLSAAPGFFVDHEDGEGLGNDVYLRGFDLEHGSGIEMRVGNIPINNPVHVQGQGYADVNFIIPEVVRSIRVLEGPFDPRQGDAAIVGSAYFDLGMEHRGMELKGSYGSFNQARVVGIVAPEGADEETFAAFAVRNSDGFGENRASQSASLNAQYSFDAGARDHVRLLATAYGARETLPGVVRDEDVAAGRIGLYDSYPYYTQGQGVQAARVILGADFDHVAPSGARFEFAPWAMFTDFRERQNYTGNIFSSQLDPNLAGVGDLWETTNVEYAVGVTSRFHAAPLHVGSWLDAAIEPGVYLRAGHTDQTKSLLDPSTLVAWDRRLDAGLVTMDAGAYLDLDLRFWKRFRISGGVRADLLYVSVDDRLLADVAEVQALTPNLKPAAADMGVVPGSTRDAQGVAVGPRVTAEYDITPELAPVISYGEGFRSLDATANVATSVGTMLTPPSPGTVNGAGPSIQEGASPYSKVRSLEAGFRAQTPKASYTATVSVFETWVDNELVFEASSGGFTTEGASVRQGLVASAIAKPFDWLLGSVAGSLQSGTFNTLAAGVVHFIPQVPPVVIRADVTAHGELGIVYHRPLTGRVGVGYTFLAGRYLTEGNSAIRGPSNNILNANASIRYANFELGVDGFNVLGLHYSDDQEYYPSNWSVNPGTPRASSAVHDTAAPPLTVVGSLAVYF